MYPNGEPPYAEPHVRWCERTVNTKIGDIPLPVGVRGIHAYNPIIGYKQDGSYTLLKIA